MKNNEYRKKPVVIQAWKWNGSEDMEGVCARCPDSDYQNVFRAHVHTIHQNQIVVLTLGDWIIPEPDGLHYYPCKPDIFEATYESVLASTEDVENEAPLNQMIDEWRAIRSHLSAANIKHPEHLKGLMDKIQSMPPAWLSSSGLNEAYTKLTKE